MHQRSVKNILNTNHSVNLKKSSVCLKTLAHIVLQENKTRGPRGPWVAHLKKRLKVTVEPIIENPRGII